MISTNGRFLKRIIIMQKHFLPSKYTMIKNFVQVIFLLVALITTTIAIRAIRMHASFPIIIVLTTADELFARTDVI